MEAIIVIVGFLGAGKTTLLKKLVNHYHYGFWSPYVILNDYQDALVDAQYFHDILNPKQIGAISGSCICCSGITELRNSVNQIPKREKGITFIEANGTTDAFQLMGFLGVGIKEHFMPPVQIAVVDTRHWQKRGDENELEANQVQVSSVVVLNYAKEVSPERREEVAAEVSKMNSGAIVVDWDDLDMGILPVTAPSKNSASKMDHQKAHWSSCSVDLPDPIASEKLDILLKEIPGSILRLKGCTRLNDDPEYTFFERTPTGEIFYRPFHGKLVSGPKLLLIGPGSHPDLVEGVLNQTV